MEQKIVDFQASSDDVLVFTGMTSKDRLAIHQHCEKIGLFTKSEGAGQKRIVKIFKTKPIVTEVEIIDEEREIFIKDFGLPIPIPYEPYFSYYIETLDPILETKKKYALLVEAVTKLAEQGKRFKHFTLELFGKIVKAISEQEVYQKFVKETGKYPCEEYPSEEDIYKKDGPEYFFSLDIIKANYNCMKYHHPAMVLDTKTWDELVKKFTDIEYFVQAKYFRQIVFGKLNPKRISLVQKYLLTELYLKIRDQMNVFGRMGSDELFVQTSKETWKKDLELLNKLIGELPENVGDIWRISPFSLKPLGTSDVYVATDLTDGSIEIKKASKDFFSQAYKYLMKLPLEKNDFKAMKDGYVITYDEPYKFNEKN